MLQQPLFQPPAIWRYWCPFRSPSLVGRCVIEASSRVWHGWSKVIARTSSTRDGRRGLHDRTRPDNGSSVRLVFDRRRRLGATDAVRLRQTDRHTDRQSAGILPLHQPFISTGQCAMHTQSNSPSWFAGSVSSAMDSFVAMEMYSAVGDSVTFFIRLLIIRNQLRTHFPACKGTVNR